LLAAPFVDEPARSAAVLDFRQLLELVPGIAGQLNGTPFIVAAVPSARIWDILPAFSAVLPRFKARLA
jgi:hypothetical protein